MDLRDAILPFSEEPLTRHMLLHLLSGYKRPFDKISELTKQQMLIPVKRGVYIPGPSLKMAGPDPFLIAHIIYGPSYISLESALSHWGMIPEKVFGTVSVTTKPSKKYNTPAGRFEYIRMPLPYYAFGLQRVALSTKQHIIMASREKALCDKIIATSGIFLRSKKQTLDFLLEDLRISEIELRTLDISSLEEWAPKAPKRSSIEMLIAALKSIQEHNQ